LSEQPPTPETFEFDDDRAYFEWLSAHPSGFVLSIRKAKGPMLHTAECPHIDRHNNPGALTERGTRKICAETKASLRAWTRSNGLGSGIWLARCPSCSP
jgi:hypothetical protein